MTLALYAAGVADRDFLRTVHHAAFREVAERQFGPWDAAYQDQHFAEAWATGSYSIVLYDG